MTHMTNMRQRGSALTVAILLLILLTLAVFVAVPAMLGEQRLSGNDVRAKIAHHVAEAGLNHTREFLRLNQLTLIPEARVPTSTALWTACGSTEVSFPCGAVEPDVTSSTVRSNHYRYVGGADGRTVTFTPGRIYDGTGTDAGNFDASYDAGILLCRLTATSACTLTSALAVGTSMFTLVSRGAVTGEGTTATVSETIGTFRLINASPNIPPLMAAGTITGLGSSTIVGNPNSGGFGVPLSVWARNNMDGGGGSWQTCQLDEYLRSSLGDVVMEGKNKDVPTCPTCDCTLGNQLSGSKVAVKEGIDILDSLDTDGGKAWAGSPYYYPCDMFEYVFGIRARIDKNANGVCETPKLADGDPTLPDVQEWLTANAQIMTCAGLNSAGDKATGLVWIKNTCGGGELDTQIGSADNPVFLVIDGSIKLNTKVKFFGMIFLRHTGDDFEKCVSDGTGCPEVLPGGGGAQVYGSIIMEGGGKLNATIDLVYLPQIIINFNRSPANNRFAGLPGSWSDRVSY